MMKRAGYSNAYNSSTVNRALRALDKLYRIGKAMPDKPPKILFRAIGIVLHDRMLNQVNGNNQ